MRTSRTPRVSVRLSCVLLLCVLAVPVLGEAAQEPALSPQVYLMDALVDGVIMGRPLHDRWLLMARRTFQLALPPFAGCSTAAPTFHVAAFRPDLVLLPSVRWVVVDVRTIRQYDCIDAPPDAPWRNASSLAYYITGSSDLPFCDGKPAKKREVMKTKVLPGCVCSL